MTASLVRLHRHRDERGMLTVAQRRPDFPFGIERVYWIADVPGGGQRGGHAHREVTELLVAAAGRFTVTCREGDRTSVFDLSAGDPAGLLVPPRVWRMLSGFSEGAVCLVLASGPYDPAEYVRDEERPSP